VLGAAHMTVVAPEVSREDRFKPEMPQIPGVNESASAPLTRWKFDARFVSVAAAIVGVIAMCAAGWWVLSTISARPRRTTEGLSSASAPSGLPEPDFSGSAARGPSVAATVDELAKPWAAKTFTFTDPVTHAAIPAMIMRLPVAANHSDAYWAFSLDVPYESCQLEYVTNLGRLASVYSFRGQHPMLVGTCNGTVYDPLRIGTAPTGAWVRGEVVRGSGIRPPISIEVHVQGRSIVASRIE